MTEGWRTQAPELRPASARSALSSIGALAALAAFATLGCGGPRSKAVDAADQVAKGYAPARLLELGRLHRRIGDSTRAEQEFAAVLASREATVDERRVALREVLATCIEAQRLRVAIDYAEPELERNPRDVALLRLFASLLSATGDAARARVVYETLVELAPRDGDAAIGLARVFRDQLADRAAATQHFERYLALAPEGPYAAEARAFLTGPTP